MKGWESWRPVFRRATRLVLLLLLAIGAVAAWRCRAMLDPIAITTAIARYPAAPLWFLAAHVVASLVFVPRTLLAIVAGLLFGMGWGVIWAELGGVAGAAAGFLIARYINSGLLDLARVARFAPALQRVERGGWRAVALLRLIPVVPHSAANYGLAVTRLGLGAYAFGSLIGQLPMTIAYVELGAAGERLFVGSAGWIEPTLFGLAALSLSLLIPAYSRWRLRWTGCNRARRRAAGGPVQ
jgi:uncharacterized membrane protein YdjX (TVP38/TMEM64 family)